jgi:hypothetical protein
VAVWHNFSSKIRDKIDFLLLRNPNIICEMIWIIIYKVEAIFTLQAGFVMIS